MSDYIALTIAAVGIGTMFYYGWKIRDTQMPDADDIELDDESSDRAKGLLKRAERRRKEIGQGKT